MIGIRIQEPSYVLQASRQQSGPNSPSPAFAEVMLPALPLQRDIRGQMLLAYADFWSRAPQVGEQKTLLIQLGIVHLEPGCQRCALLCFGHGSICIECLHARACQRRAISATQSRSLIPVKLSPRHDR